MLKIVFEEIYLRIYIEDRIILLKIEVALKRAVFFNFFVFRVVFREFQGISSHHARSSKVGRARFCRNSGEKGKVGSRKCGLGFSCFEVSAFAASNSFSNSFITSG